MEDQQQSRWRPTRKQLLWAGVVAALAAALAFFAIVICGYLFGWKWTGLPKWTLWDWLDLLIVPIVLEVGGYLFTRSENRSTQASAERSTQDDALQGYLDYMSGLLIPNKDLPSLYKARPGDSLSSVARARTLAVLSRLDGDRKASVVRFLAEADLIERDNPVLSLARANLRGASLSGAYLYGTRLTLANLGEANLSGAVLATAHLDRADLAGAYLGEAKLMRADLRDADLRGADLRGARGQPLTWKAQARSLKGATMPNGLKYEKWLKTPEGQNWLNKHNKGRAEDGENSSPS